MGDVWELDGKHLRLPGVQFYSVKNYEIYIASIQKLCSQYLDKRRIPK